MYDAWFVRVNLALGEDMKQARITSTLPDIRFLRVSRRFPINNWWSHNFCELDIDISIYIWVKCLVRWVCDQSSKLTVRLNMMSDSRIHMASLRGQRWKDVNWFALLRPKPCCVVRYHLSVALRLNINILKQSTFQMFHFVLLICLSIIMNEIFGLMASSNKRSLFGWFFAPRSQYAVGLCLQDHSLPWSQSMVSFVWLCNWATKMPCSQLWQGTFYFPRFCKKFVLIIVIRTFRSIFF